MSISAASKPELSREEILSEMVQRELRAAAVVWPQLMDLSNRFSQGTTKAKIPRSSAKTVGDTPSDGTELADSDTVFTSDTLELNQFKTIHDYVYDVDQQDSVLDLKAEFYNEAMPELAEYIEAQAVAALIAGRATANDFQLEGSSDGGTTLNDAITLDQLGELNQQMTEAKISKQNRVLLVSPKQARILRSYDAVRDASKYGNSDSIQNGFVARLEGFDILESVDLTANQVIACHKDCAAKAVAKAMAIDEQRQSSKKRWFCSADASYGIKTVRSGELIFFGSNAAVA